MELVIETAPRYPTPVRRTECGYCQPERSYSQFFHRAGNAAVVVLLESGDVDLSLLLSVDYANKGFYKASQCNVFNSYFETNDKDKLEAEISNMKKEVSPDSDRLFCLGWGLTQDATDVPGMRSIKELAAGLYPELYRHLIKNCSKQAYPNILSIDYMSPNRDIVALAMAVNGFAA